MRIKPTPVAALTTLMASMLLAQSANASTQAQWLPYNPRLQVSGTLSQEGIFNADGLVPLYGNWDGFVYGAVNARYSTDDTGLLAPGLGFRTVAHNRLYGAYVFADAARTHPKANFWVINPGIEWASPRWDMHVNGYIPTKRSQQLGQADFYSNYGDYSRTSFAGHSEYDELGALSMVVGQGLDAEVGYSIPMQQYRSRIFLGGYYFSMPQQLKAVQGVAGGLQLPLNAYTDLILTDSYDKLRRHEVSLSVRLTLGNKNTYSDDVHDRMLERVERHVGRWSTGNGVISQQAIQATGQSAIYKDNIWFFKPGGNTAAEPVSLQACTFEHPCSQFDQQTIDSINQVSANANFYLTPGTYTIAPTGNQAAEMFQLNQGQSIYGRNETYRAPATGDARALLVGPVKALGNNSFDSIQIVNSGVVTQIDFDGSQESIITALYLPETTTGAVTLTNAAMRAVGNDESKVMGVLVRGGHLAVQQSMIQADSMASATYGIYSLGDSQTTLDNSNVQARSVNGFVHGSSSWGNSEINFNDSNIQVENTDGGADGIQIWNNSKISLANSSVRAENIKGEVNGIHVMGGRETIVKDSSIQAKSVVGAVNGVKAWYGYITLDDSNIQASSETGLVAGANAYSLNGRINLNRSNIQVSSESGDVSGIYNWDSVVNLDGGSIKAESVGGKVIGVESWGENLTELNNTTLNNTNLQLASKNGDVTGIYSFGSRVKLNESSIQAESAHGNVTGLHSESGVINVENIQLDVNGTDGKIQLATGNNINFSGQNICKKNGVVVEGCVHVP